MANVLLGYSFLSGTKSIICPVGWFNLTLNLHYPRLPNPLWNRVIQPTLISCSMLPSSSTNRHGDRHQDIIHAATVARQHVSVIGCAHQGVTSSAKADVNADIFIKYNIICELLCKSHNKIETEETGGSFNKKKNVNIKNSPRKREQGESASHRKTDEYSKVTNQTAQITVKQTTWHR